MLEALGIVLVGVSISLYAWCVWLFVVAGRGTPLPFASPREFVARGPYHHTRNPMALSVVAGAVGLSLALGASGGLLASAVLAGLLHLYITRREEPELARRFGGPYLAYREQVPRWLPRRRAAVPR